MTKKKKCVVIRKILRGTRGAGLIKPNDFPLLCSTLPFSNSLCKFLSVITNHRHHSYGFQTWCMLLKIPQSIFLCLNLTIQTLEQCNSLWKEHRTTQSSLCLRIAASCLIELYGLSEGPSLRLTKSTGAELCSSSCQWRWNARPLTGILTLRHFDKSDWCFLSGDWEWQGRSSWILNVGGRAEIVDGEQFWGTRQGDSWCVCECAWGFINVSSFLAVRVETQIIEPTWVETQLRTKWLKKVAAREREQGRLETERESWTWRPLKVIMAIYWKQYVH